MKNIFKIVAVVALTTVITLPAVYAGNDNRRGTAGAPELLINPWARSSGWGSVNVANSRGIDAFFANIAGLSFVEKTEAVYSNTIYLGGKNGLRGGANINALGLGQRLSDNGVMGIYIMAMSFGDIPVTSVSNPEPGSAGTFSPSMMNINVSYAYSFTHSIHGGGTIKVISESTDEISGSGFAIDAGIQYVTGADDELKFGIALKNIGPVMNFEGTGMSFRFVNESNNNMTAEYRSGDMELPTSLSIGLSYDFLFEKWDQRLTLAAAFTSNAFLKDNFALGCEYSLMDRVQVRAGYVYQRGLHTSNSTTFNNGLSCGASFNVPLSKEGKSALVIDYSFRLQSKMRSTHTIGASIRL